MTEKQHSEHGKDHKHDDHHHSERPHAHDLAPQHVHSHSHDHNQNQDNKNIAQEDDDHKQTRGEKKFKKAMMKMGLKPVENIVRVTLKTNKNMIMYVDEPFVMKSSETAYVIFGEAKIFDFGKAMAEKQAQKFQQPEGEIKKKNLDEIKEIKEDHDDVPEEIGDIKEEDVQNLISYSNCSRNVAIKTLKATKGDIVEAITRLS